MIQRHEVQVLLAAGFSQRQVAKKTGVSRRTVLRIAAEAPVEGFTETGVVANRGVGRPSTVAAFRERLQEILGEEPALPTVELLHRLREQG